MGVSLGVPVKLWVFACLWLIAALCLIAAPAKADVGGQIPGPGLCDYPGIGGSSQVTNVYTYLCDFPVEENGSHWHCEWGGANVTASIGVNILMFSAGVSGYVGGVLGTCSWRCPDNTVSASAPNPPGAWKNHLVPKRCVSVPAPPPPEQPERPQPERVDMNQGKPQPAVTNPENPNPDATQNP